MPTKRMSAGCVSWGGGIALIGGTSGGGAVLSSIDVWAGGEEGVGEWLQNGGGVPALPSPRQDAAVFVAGGKLWVVGGSDRSGALETSIYLEEGGEAWVEGPPMHSGSHSLGVCAL